MRRLIAIAAVAVFAALVLPAAPSGAGVVATTDVYAVHGLNVGLADGSAVTVCTGPVEIDGDFRFGEIIGPVELPSGQAVPIQVYVGAGQDCATPAGAPLIDQEVTPTGDVVSLVATAFPLDDGEPELLPFQIDVDCVDPGTGRAVAAHAANAPAVDVFNTNLDLTFGPISYGQQIPGPLPPATYGIEVYISPDGPLVTEFDVVVEEGKVSIGYAVGNQPIGDEEFSDIVLIPQVIDVETCEQPTTTTTVAPTTTTAAAQPTALQPTFTG